MSDKRKVTTDALETLGTIIDGDAGRDAIHLAVEPVIAGERLMPGQHIGLSGGIAYSGIVKLVGIVDPFIKGFVDKGERFWLIVYPRQITSLRHVWEHPDFTTETVPKTTSGPSAKEISEAWLREFCSTADCPPYEVTIAAAAGESIPRFEEDDNYGSYYTNDGEYLLFQGRNASGSIPPEFWDHVEIVTGKKIRRQATHFSCSC